MSTVVMTGATSGIGAAVAEVLVHSEGARLVVGARRESAVGERVPLDLTRLGSVREFARAATDLLDGVAVDALLLNAGIVRGDADGRTEDGFETTFAVNHLSQYLLLRIMMPVLADGAVVVLTTSGTHDPATGSDFTTPRHADARLLAHPERDADLEPRPRSAGQHAYTASKLCVILTARALGRDPEVQARGISAVALCPGQVFGTGLARDLSLPMRVAFRVLGTPVGAPLRRFSPTVNRLEAATTALVDLALQRATTPDGDHYAAVRRESLTWLLPSDLARDDALADALWQDSAELVGLPNG